MNRLSLAPSPLVPRLDWRAFLLAALFALAALFTYTQANRFPATYHPDEPSKARQILNQAAGKKDAYNFHHPMLMLTGTTVLTRLAGTPLEIQAVTVAGRWVSALFTSGAVFLLVLLAALLAGPFAAFAAGALLLINHELFELAHYFKEDPALLFGVSAFFLALALYDRAPGWSRALLLGAGLGLAISGKYVGAAVAPFALFVLWQHRQAFGFGRALALLLLGCVLVLVAANIPILLHPHLFADGFTREVDFVVVGHKGITRSVPHGVYWKIFLDAVMPIRWLPIVGLLLVAYYASLWLRRRAATAAEWALAIFPIAFALMLSFSPKTHHRYFLPDSALLLVLASLVLAQLRRFRWNDRPLPAALAPALLAAAILVQLPTFLDYYRGFRHEGRAAMAEYLRAHVAPGTVIVQDKRVDLDALGLPYEFWGKLFAADQGTIDQLRAWHVEYVAVAEGDYGRFDAKALRATDAGAADFNRRREFYHQLFAEGELIFECPPGTLQYLQPRLKLYRLRPAATPAPSATPALP
jgi:hypothetical protein